MHDEPPELEQEIDSPDNKVPLICRVTREQLLYAVNQNFGPENQIPHYAQITVKVPGGGDYSGTDLTIERDIVLEIRWQGEYFGPS